MLRALEWAGWNLFLALIPMVLGYALAWGLQRSGKRRNLPFLICVLLGVAWLLFLPNSCYLLTEWRKLLFDPAWMRRFEDSHGTDHGAMLSTAKSALLFLGYSGLGVLMFVLAIRPVERWMRSVGQRFYLYAPFLFYIVSLGVYLGLILRFNSWDAVTQPRLVWEAIDDAIFSKTVLLAVGVFGLILWGLYEAVDLWVDGFRQTLKNWGLVRA